VNHLVGTYEGTQSMDASRAKSPIAAAAVVGFIAARPLFWYQSSLLRLWGGYAAKLLLDHSALLRLWADKAPKPLFEFQSSLFRLCADDCELVARSCEERVEALSTAMEQQQLGTLLQNLPTRLGESSEDHLGRLGQKEVSPNSDEAQEANEPVTVQTSDLVAEDMGRGSETSVKLATDQDVTAVKHAAMPLKETAKSVSEAPNAGQRTPRISKARVERKAFSTKKSARKTMKSQKEPDRK
jgi:hypothetical protein